MPVFKSNRDLDTTLLLIGLLILFLGCVAGLFMHDIFFSGKTGTFLLTEALVHTILGFIGGWISSMVTFFFGMKARQPENSTQQQGEEKDKELPK